MGMLHPALLWLVIGTMLFLLEMALPGFVLFFFALGSLITALAAWLFPISIAWQLALFITASLISLFSLRRIILRQLLDPETEDGVKDKDNVLATPGQKGVVSTTITPPAEGRIKYSGSFWRATAVEAIEEGEIISVIRQEGLVIHVEKV
jgi:membrane protein implicated in regulation of membrane protease activity